MFPSTVRLKLDTYIVYTHTSTLNVCILMCVTYLHTEAQYIVDGSLQKKRHADSQPNLSFQRFKPVIHTTSKVSKMKVLGKVIFISK